MIPLIAIFNGNFADIPVKLSRIRDVFTSIYILTFPNVCYVCLKIG